MNTRLSQRVYSEAALEFWLQRLEGDWEEQFSEAELAEGRRLYRQGAVRQLELGDTDAIVHMRPDGADEVYVVLDWQGKALSVRASVEDQRQRRQLAVAGLYEVEELVGDEAAALAPETLSKPAATQQDTPAEGDSATGSASHADGTPRADAGSTGNTTPAQGQQAGAGTDRAKTGANGSGGNARHDAQKVSGGATRQSAGAASAASGKNADTRANTVSPQNTATHEDTASAKNAASPRNAAELGIATKGSAAAEGDAVAGHGAGSGSAETTAQPAPEPERRLELHFSLKQGLLLFRAGWRQRGRKRLVPALGETAPSAETMTAGERETLIRLASLARRSGFRYDKGQGGYRLDNAERMEQFVGKELGGWSEFFDVTQETDVSLLARGVQEVSLRARIGEGTDGSLSLHWMAGFEQDLPGSEHLPAFTSAERRRLLRSGATPLLLPGRGLVRLSEKQAKASERLSDAVSLFPGGTAPRYLLFSLTGLSDLPVEVSASLQRWRQSVLGGNLDPKPQSTGKAKSQSTGKAKGSAGAVTGVAVESAPAASTGVYAVSASSVSTAQTTEDGAAQIAGQPQPLPEFLRPYQRLGVGWMRHLFERGCHGLLADEMGLGKTVQVLSLIATAVADESSSAADGIHPVAQGISAASADVSASPDSAETALASAQSVSAAGVSSGSVSVASSTESSSGSAAAAGGVPAFAGAEPSASAQSADVSAKGEVAAVAGGIAASGLKPSLVVCPASVVPVWQAQAAQFFPHLKVRVLGAGCTFTSDNTERTDLWLASYTQLRRHKPLLEQVQFARAVLDEAQFIKNPEAKVTQACLSIKAEHRLALTGTPLENRYLDVWTLFRFLMPGLLGTRRRFEEGLVADEAKHLATLRKQLAPFILRRTKSEVASELPEKVELDLYCPLSDMQRTEYRRLLTEGMALYEGSGQKSTAANVQKASMQRELAANAVEASQAGESADSGQPGLMSVLTLLTRLRQVSCDPALLPWMHEAGLHHSGKLNLLRDRLGEVFANGKKAVVFSQFVKFLDRAKQAIAADYPDVPVYQLIGTTRDRTRPVERFQAQEGAGVMLVSLKAGGTGITLHAADYVFLLDPWWNPAVEAQAVDRVHRIGQVNRVFVYRMVTAETVEARIAALKQTKRERFEQIMSGASGGDDFREAFRSLESLLGLLKESDAPEATAQANDAEENAANDEERQPAVQGRQLTAKELQPVVKKRKAAAPEGRQTAKKRNATAAERELTSGER